MNPDTHSLVDEQLLSLQEQLGAKIESPEFAGIRECFLRMNQAAGPSESVILECRVLLSDRFDRGLQLLHLNLFASSDLQSVRQEWSDYSRHRYTVDGEKTVVPHIFCPSCWEPWHVTTEFGECDHCGAELGVDVMRLLDDHLCPKCEGGRVTPDVPVCSECGHVVDPAFCTFE